MKYPVKLKSKPATHLDLFLDQCLLLILVSDGEYTTKNIA